MKATLFSIAALAAGAIATPLAAQVDNVQMGNSLTKMSARDVSAQAVNVARADKPATGSNTQTDAAGKAFVAQLQSTVSDIKAHVSDVKDTAAKVKSGAMSKADGEAAVKAQMAQMNNKLTDLHSQVKAVSRVGVAGTFFGDAASLIIALFNDVVTAAETVVGTFGGSIDLSSGVHELFGLVNDVIARLSGAAVGLVPSLVGVLGEIIAGLSGGVAAAAAPVSATLASLPASN